MPILARAKRDVARRINSKAMDAGATQTEFCLYLSANCPGGLLLKALFGWWWAEPVAGLAMTPVIAGEGFAAVRGKRCSCGVCH